MTTNLDVSQLPFDTKISFTETDYNMRKYITAWRPILSAMMDNGVLKQNFNTDDMAHSIAKSIAFVSSIHALLPGDILATGTNHRGLHAIQDGDRLELEVDGLGRLAVNVRDTVERAWPRETRLERQTAGLDGMAPQASGKYASA